MISWAESAKILLAMRLVRQIIPLCVSLLVAQLALAQQVAVNIRFDVNKGKHTESTVKIARDGTNIKTIDPSRSRLTESLDFGHDYILTFEKPGYITKRIAISTKGVPKDVQDDELDFDFVVEIFQQYEGINTVVFNQPVARYFYDAKEDGFAYDTDYTKSIRAALSTFEEAYKEQEKVQQNPFANATAKAEEEKRKAAEARAAEEQRVAAEARAAEEKRSVQQKAEQERIALEEKAAEEARKAEEARLGEESRQTKLRAEEDERQAAMKAAEDERKALEARQAEDTRLAKMRSEEDARNAAAIKAGEDERNALRAKQEEDARQARMREEEEARKAAELNAAEEQRLAQQAMQAEEARSKAEAARAEDDRKQAALVKAEEERRASDAERAATEQRKRQEQAMADEERRKREARERAEREQKASANAAKIIAEQKPMSVADAGSIVSRTENIFREGTKEITEVTVNRERQSFVYRMVRHDWGGLYYFKNDNSITKRDYDVESTATK